MPRRPEIGNVQLYPNRPLQRSDKNGYVLKFYCPIHQKRIRKNCGTRDRREARRIQRECRERLLNGRYIESGGAIAETHELVRGAVHAVLTQSSEAELQASRTWDECLDTYKQKHKRKTRENAHEHSASRLDIAQRILQARREDAGLTPEGPIVDFTTLDSLEYLQERLREGDEGLYDHRAPTTVNTMMGAVMAFVRFCKTRGWIPEVPPIEKLSVDDAMKGRPITVDEFDRMLEATPLVVGERSADSWVYVLNVLWESAFRIGDIMNFSWDDDRRIHPIWPSRKEHFPTLAIPSTQKNKKTQEIPMLPGLRELLERTPKADRRGWVVNPEPIDYVITTTPDWCKPVAADLADLAQIHNNSAIARACGVTETSIRKWLREAGIRRSTSKRRMGDVDKRTMKGVRRRAESSQSYVAKRSVERLTKEHVSRIISRIGAQAGIIVQQPDEETGKRLKYASAHDIRRGCAQRLINAGVSAETLKLVMRHKDFSTTERFYGATRAAQSAAVEINEKLAATRTESAIAAGLEESPQLSTAELRKLKALLNTL